ncbi:cytochrome c oxidase subunit II [uncultured Brevibacterium sp.]|uniref:aa3-type cytochrome oxidase subunit II n=1 Tax=uncultured Brevibacterium sp. TaxID=189678 RepID=UPI0025EFF298|nr:cytochrome c oxidase subunit II [uncultured Brevibacterium sp.]
MDSPNQPVRKSGARWAKRVGVLGGLASTVLLAGCTKEQWEVGFFPPESKGATSHTDHYISLWNGSWIALLAVGAITWGLMLFCIIAFRRRKNDRGLPVQVQYNMPVEILYTVLPIILVVGFFFATVNTLDKTVYDDTPGEVKVEVVGKQWAWDFNYLTENAYYGGKQVNLDGTEQPGIDAPTLYLPSNTDVEIELRSRDVIHSFWIPAFLEKRDMIPGRVETLHLRMEKEGEYLGKCAELCGEFHAEMIFNVKVVSLDEYKAYTEKLKAEGNEGRLGPELDRTEWYKNPYTKEGEK